MNGSKVKLHMSFEARLLVALDNTRKHLKVWANRRAWKMVRKVLDCLKKLQTWLNLFGWKFNYAEENG